MSPPPNDVPTSMADTEGNDGSEGGTYGFLDNVANFFTQVGFAGLSAAAIATGKTSTPVYLINGTPRPVWVAIWAETENGAPEFPRSGWHYKAWYRIPPGGKVYPFDTYSSGFYYCANDDQGHQWGGDYPATFVDATGKQYNRKMRYVEIGSGWLTFSNYTLKLTR